MASTYSPNLRLELIGTGEQQGTWGATTNTNLGTLLEEAIGGYTSVTVADAGDTTLTTANGAADQSRNMTLNLSGTLTATRNVICPAIEKIYVVKNATSGGFAVTFKVTGQTGVSIPNGATMLIYVDGVDARQAGAAIGASNALIATSIELGGTTDTTITRSSAGVIAVEGGVVPKENRANTFTANQEVTGDILQTWAASMDRFLGSKFSTTYELGTHFLEASRETRIVSKAADSTGLISFYTGVTPSERMRIDASGNVIIGGTVATDSSKLTVAGGISNIGTQFNARPGSGVNYEIVNRIGAGFDFYVNNAGTLAARIDSSGNVGIGTSTPGAKLDIVATGATTAGNVTRIYNNTDTATAGVLGLVKFGSAASTYGPYSANTVGVNSAYTNLNVGTETAHPLVLYTSNAERVRIDSSGNVGIGTSSPASATLSGYSGKLTIDGTGTYYNQSNNYRSPASFSTAGVVTNLAIPLYAGGGSVRSICVAYNSDTLEFARASNSSATGGVTIDMVINGSGNVGIGTATFGTSAATVLAIATGTAPSTGPADTIQIFSTDLSAGNTILSLRTEGTPVNANTTAAATHRIAVRINGTVYYLLANTAA